jgi:hypothetical protein
MSETYNAPLFEFEKDGKTSILDIREGVLTFGGDVEVSDAAAMLFQHLANCMPDYMIERFHPVKEIDGVPVTTYSHNVYYSEYTVTDEGQCPDIGANYLATHGDAPVGYTREFTGWVAK